MDDESVLNEKERLLELIKDMSEKRKKTLIPVIENVAWMKVKLDETREQIKHTKVAIKYDNGGGQTGIRENPLFKGYEALWKSYIAGMDRILNSLPPEQANEAIPLENRPRTVLEIVRERVENERKSGA